MNEERELIQQSAREFAQKKVRSHVAKMEFEEADSRELVLEAGKLGFLGLALPEKFGGAGPDFVSYALFLEEIGRESITVGCTSFFQYLFVDMLTFSGSCPKHLVDNVVIPATRGDLLLAMAVTESTGSSYFEGFQTSYEEDGDELVINGSKVFISQIDVCDYYLLAARPKLADGQLGGVDILVVPAKAEGVKVGHIENKLGLNGSRTGQVYFENVRIPKENKAPYGASFDVMGLYGPVFLGVAKTVLEKTVTYLKQRVQYGQSLWDLHETIRNEVADLQIQVNNFEQVVYGFVANRNNGVVDAIGGFGSKITGTELVEHVTSKCMVLMGGPGVVRETGIERFFRDAKVMQIGCGSNGMIRSMIASGVGAQSGSYNFH